MPATAERELSIQQPDGDPIALNDDYGAVRQYKAVFKELGGRSRKAPEVAPHLIAGVVESANSMGIPNDEVAQISRDLQAADEIVREVPNTPIIYHLHCEDAIGLTPHGGTDGFRVIDTRVFEDRKSLYTAIPTRAQLRIRGWGRESEGEWQITEGTDMTMHSPLSFLTSDDSETVSRFLDYRPEWMRYPNSHVVVGRSAVFAYLRDQSRREVLGEGGKTTTKGLVDGKALLASAALKKLGYDSPIGNHGDFVHQAGMEGMADVVASGLGYRPDLLMWDDYGDRVMRRFAGIDFRPEEDAKVIGEKAADRLLSEEEGTRRKFTTLLHGDRGQLESYLTETAGNFMTHFVVAKSA